MIYQTIKHLRHIGRRFKSNKDGSVAIEYSVLALPFFVLLFGIFESAIIFFIDSTVSHSLNDTVRQIRTGHNDVNCYPGIRIKRKICRRMAGLGDCQNKLRVDVVKAPNGKFSTGLLSVTPGDQDDNQPPPMRPDFVQASGPGDVVVVRAEYYYKLALPGSLTGLANRGGNTRLLQSTTAFRNEPFPDRC